MTRTNFFVVAMMLLIAVGSLTAQTNPSTQPTVANSLPPGWEEIDQRLVFFTTQLASVETSLDAVNKALEQAGYHQTAKKQEAEQLRGRNDEMDLNGGGPVKWQDFYGKTAERFFYHPDKQVSATIVDSNDLKSSPQSPSQRNEPGPPSARPPQFDYIYRANENAQKCAEAEVAALGGKIDALVERRRQLETEQTAIWAKIAFRAVASRRFTSKPIYRFELRIEDSNDAALQRQEAIRSATAFVRIATSAVSEAADVADDNTAATFDALHRVIDSANSELNTRLTKLPALTLDSADAATPLGRLVASTDRLSEVSKNISESYRLAMQGDKAGDDQQKLKFRGYLQQRCSISRPIFTPPARTCLL